MREKMANQPLRVEVVIYSPDDAPDIEHTFINGVQVDSIEVHHLDPGAGYSLSDWRQEWDGVTHQASPAAAELIRKYAKNAERSPYIQKDESI